jgi:hypothetical protein
MHQDRVSDGFDSLFLRYLFAGPLRKIRRRTEQIAKKTLQKPGSGPAGTHPLASPKNLSRRNIFQKFGSYTEKSILRNPIFVPSAAGSGCRSGISAAEKEYRDHGAADASITALPAVLKPN